MRVVVPSDLDGQRCDRVVSQLGGMSRADAKSLVASGGVRCAGEVVDDPRRPVAAGEDLEFEAIVAPGLQPAAIDLEVAYEDPHLAIVVKPTGMVTHPGAGDTGPTLAAAVLHRWPEVRGVGVEDRWGIVHRLDRDTSGLIVVALTAEAEAGLRAAIKDHRVVREYLALVHGAPATPTGTIDAPVGRDPRRPTRMRLDPGGRRAVTHYRVEERLGGFTLLRVTLETGRTHQIRVHLGAIELPVAGDRVYGRAAGSPRVFLHAARLAFTHPVSGDEVAVDSPLPADLAAVLVALR